MEHESDLGVELASWPRRQERSSHLSREMRGAEIAMRKTRTGLERLVSDAIVPRLRMIHEPSQAAHSSTSAFSHEAIAEFSALAMDADASKTTAYLDEMRSRGLDLETLFSELLAPAARYLGQLWDQDLCQFIDVTMGVARLQQLLASFGLAAEPPGASHRQCAFLVTLPEEKHCFGIDLVARLMQDEGWDVIVSKGRGGKDIAATVRNSWCDVLGVTLSADCGFETVGRMISSIRKTSRNANLGVMVGGPAFAGRPARAIQVGADAVADDAKGAVILANKLWHAQPVRG